ncbi:hypothetical protein C8R44DRAFT_798924 [Mycena epipterygia]|nr:hypothetical protein C8R44DRAFT_798924 [Mycena epipterygia]
MMGPKAWRVVQGSNLLGFFVAMPRESAEAGINLRGRSNYAYQRAHPHVQCALLASCSRP